MFEKDDKRLFFGAEIYAAWPKELPHGRIIEEPFRHITLAFLGQTSLSHIQKLIPALQQPNFRIGIVGKIDRFLFLPQNSPRVIAGHVHWLSPEDGLALYQKSLVEKLTAEGYKLDKREFLSHVTIARAPFVIKEWQAIFSEIPVMLKAIHLYESAGNLSYYPLWSHSFVPAFEEFEHTADIAFLVRAENMQQMHLHAQMALCFKFPALLSFMPTQLFDSLQEIVIGLNELIARADQEIGCPFKAVSFHGDVTTSAEGLLQWEMIVDV